MFAEMDVHFTCICFADIGPVPCHSAGVGRTGTFITVDAMMQRLKEKDDLDIYNFVTQMRTKRTFMVQNLVSRPTVFGLSPYKHIDYKLISSQEDSKWPVSL